MTTLLDRAQQARAVSRQSRASASRSRLSATICRLAGHHVAPVIPIAAHGDVVCALDGDGTTLCTGSTIAPKIIGYDWLDVPRQKQCLVCAILLRG